MNLVYRVLTGPTAAGKTNCLLERAHNRCLAVISADSRQVYQGMDIGTGKPTATDLEILPHHVLNLSSVLITFSVYQFIIESARVFRNLEEVNSEIWVCGGTGLYIRALLEGLPLRAGPRPRLREALENSFKKTSVVETVERLGIELSEPSNPVRVIRACEAACSNTDAMDKYYITLGLDRLDWDDDERSQTSDVTYRKAVDYLKNWRCEGIAVLDPGVEVLRDLIARRVRAMFEGGLLDEVRTLETQGLADAPVVRDGIAYREALAVLHGEIELEPAIEQAVIRTRQYAKRQRTYFRGQRWPEHTDCRSCIGALGLG